MDATTLIAYLIAVTIPILAFYIVSALDLFGTGKWNTLGICMAWGALGAFSIAYGVNRFILLNAFGYETLVRLAGPVFEEFLKALVLIYFIRQPRFRYIVDGAVYGFSVGIGFSVTENISYISSQDTGVLILAISRVLSTSLMHATSSAMVGIALGRLRRFHGAHRFRWPVIGISTAIVLHVLFNNLVAEDILTGVWVLLFAIGFGLAGSVVIGQIIGMSLNEEKRRFNETLGINVGVSSAERRAVQELGGEVIEKILDELGDFFGEDKIERIRKLLITQANIGILSNNLKTPSSERLRQAWQDEIKHFRSQIDDLRHELGVYIMSFLRNIFPEDDVEIQSVVNEGLAQFDPNHIHTFDMFASARASTLTPKEMEQVAANLKKIAIFKDVPLVDLENLCRAVNVRDIKAGQILFKKGEEGNAMFMIEQGQIDIFITSGNQEKVLRSCFAGDVFGEMSLLDGQPRSASARALTDLVVMELRRDDFMRFIQSRPHMILIVLRFLTAKVRDTTKAIEDSTASIRDIAAGNYQVIQKHSLIATKEKMQMPVMTQPAEITSLEVAIETDTGTTPALLGGAFAMLATALQQREQSLSDTVALHTIAAGRRKERKVNVD